MLEVSQGERMVGGRIHMWSLVAHEVGSLCAPFWKLGIFSLHLTGPVIFMDWKITFAVLHHIFYYFKKNLMEPKVQNYKGKKIKNPHKQGRQLDSTLKGTASLAALHSFCAHLPKLLRSLFLICLLSFIPCHLVICCSIGVYLSTNLVKQKERKQCLCSSEEMRAPW